MYKYVRNRLDARKLLSLAQWLITRMHCIIREFVQSIYRYTYNRLNEFFQEIHLRRGVRILYDAK